MKWIVFNLIFCFAFLKNLDIVSKVFISVNLHIHGISASPPHFVRKWSGIFSDRKKDYQQKRVPWKVFLFFHCLLLRIFPVVLVYFAPFWFMCNGGTTLNNLFFLRGKIALLDKLREKAYKDGFLKQVFLSNKEWNVYLFNHQRRMTEDCFHLRLLLANKISCLSFYWKITWFLKHDTVVNKGNFFGLAAACDRLKIYRLYKKNPHFT